MNYCDITIRNDLSNNGQNSQSWTVDLAGTCYAKRGGSGYLLPPTRPGKWPVRRFENRCRSAAALASSSSGANHQRLGEPRYTPEFTACPNACFYRYVDHLKVISSPLFSSHDALAGAVPPSRSRRPIAARLFGPTNRNPTAGPPTTSSSSTVPSCEEMRMMPTSLDCIRS